MFTLTLHTVVTNALKFRAEGKLGAQRGATVCLNRYNDGSCCVIGASIPDEILDQSRYLNGADIRLLVDKGYVEVATPDELNEMGALQIAHDTVCTAQHRDSAMIGFNRLLDEMAQKLGL